MSFFLGNTNSIFDFEEVPVSLCVPEFTLMYEGFLLHEEPREIMKINVQNDLSKKVFNGYVAIDY